jgi:hypothetical protein
LEEASNIGYSHGSFSDFNNTWSRAVAKRMATIRQAVCNRGDG